MNVLIKGMEMPIRCGECLLAKLSPTGESLICNYMLSRVSWEKRPFDCPLVPIPPHGRLIDADALIADVRAHSESYFADDFAHEWVDVAPTIIPTSKEGET